MDRAKLITLVIDAVSEGFRIKPVQEAIRRTLIRHGVRDRVVDRVVSGLTYNVFRYQGLLEHIVREHGIPYFPSLPVRIRAALLLTTYLNLFDKKRRKTTIRHYNRLIKRYAEKHGRLEPGIHGFITNIGRIEWRPKTEEEEIMTRYLVSPELYGALRDAFHRLNEDLDSFLKHTLNPPPRVFRVNTLKASPQAIIKTLSYNHVDVEPGRYSNRAVRVSGRLPIEAIRLVESGVLVPQDESSIMAVELLDPRPGSTIADLCSAPGGKTTLLAEYTGLKSIVHSFEVNKGRARRLRSLVERTGVKNVVRIHVADARDSPRILGEGSVDYVLLDPPCSSTGAIARNPDARWRYDPGEVYSIARLQYDLLEAGWKILRRGGRLMYTVCSVLPMEGEDLISLFIERRGDAEIVSLTKPFTPSPILSGTMRAYPHRHGVIGFYYALLEKR